MHYFRALYQPFIIAPILTSIQLAYNLINIVIAPIRVLVTAYLINTTLHIIQNEGNWNSLFWSLVSIIIMQLYGYIAEPLLSLIETKWNQKSWISIDYPMVKTCAALDIKHRENSDTMDLIDRIWSGKPSSQIFGVWSNFLEFRSCVH